MTGLAQALLMQMTWQTAYTMHMVAGLSPSPWYRFRSVTSSAWNRMIQYDQGRYIPLYSRLAAHAAGIARVEMVSKS